MSAPTDRHRYRRPVGHDGRCAWLTRRSTGHVHRVSPEQKNRVILGLKARGTWSGISATASTTHVLHTADVGISVMNGVDVAKDAARSSCWRRTWGSERRGNGRAAVLRQHHEYIIMGPAQLRQHVQHGRGIAVPEFLPMLPTRFC